MAFGLNNNLSNPNINEPAKLDTVQIPASVPDEKQFETKTVEPSKDDKNQVTDLKRGIAATSISFFDQDNDIISGAVNTMLAKHQFEAELKVFMVQTKMTDELLDLIDNKK